MPRQFARWSTRAIEISEQIQLSKRDLCPSRPRPITGTFSGAPNANVQGFRVSALQSDRRQIGRQHNGQPPSVRGHARDAQPRKRH